MEKTKYNNLSKKLETFINNGGGNVIVWEAVAASGAGKLEFIECNIDRYQYKSILEHNLKESVDVLSLGGSWIFQQQTHSPIG